MITIDHPAYAAAKICNIPPQLFDNDVNSLFTNVPLNRIVNIILDCVYNENLVNTNLRKRTLKKLIEDTCSKTVFTANEKLYQQIDGVSMSSSLGPLLGNIIMTELERKFIKQFIDNKNLMFYGRYVDDTLVVIKPEDLNSCT